MRKNSDNVDGDSLAAESLGAGKFKTLVKVTIPIYTKLLTNYIVFVYSLSHV